LNSPRPFSVAPRRQGLGGLWLDLCLEPGAVLLPRRRRRGARALCREPRRSAYRRGGRRRIARARQIPHRFQRPADRRRGDGRRRQNGADVYRRAAQRACRARDLRDDDRQCAGDPHRAHVARRRHCEGGRHFAAMERLGQSHSSHGGEQAQRVRPDERLHHGGAGGAALGRAVRVQPQNSDLRRLRALRHYACLRGDAQRVDRRLFRAHLCLRRALYADRRTKARFAFGALHGREQARSRRGSRRSRARMSSCRCGSS